MDAIFSFFGGIDSKTIVIIVAIAVIIFLFSILKKAFKAAALIFAIGFVFAIGKPIVLNALAGQGVTIDGTVISVEETDGSTLSFDAGLIKQFETTENGDGANSTLTVTFSDGNSQSYQVPTTAADGVETAIQIVSGIATSGYNAGTSAGAQN